MFNLRKSEAPQEHAHQERPSEKNPNGLGALRERLAARLRPLFLVGAGVAAAGCSFDPAPLRATAPLEDVHYVRPDADNNLEDGAGADGGLELDGDLNDRAANPDEDGSTDGSTDSSIDGGDADGAQAPGDATLLPSEVLIVSPTFESTEPLLVHPGAREEVVAAYRLCAPGGQRGVHVSEVVVVNDRRPSGDFETFAPTSQALLNDVRIRVVSSGDMPISPGPWPVTNSQVRFFPNTLSIAPGQCDQVEILADVSAAAESGESFRLGLPPTRLVARAENSTDAVVPTFTSSTSITERVVRYSQPTFSLDPAGPPAFISMNEGINRLYSFSVAASANSDISLARLGFVMRVEGLGAPGANIGDMGLYLPDGSRIPCEIWARPWTTSTLPRDVGRGGFIAGPMGGVADDLYDVIVNFPDEVLRVPAAEIINLRLLAGFQGLGSVTTATVSTDFSANEDRYDPVTGLSGGATCGPFNNQPCGRGGNTGRVYDQDPGEALFSTPEDLRSTYVVGRNIIWADGSVGGAESNGVGFVAGGGAPRFTNGFGLTEAQLNRQVLQKR